MTVTAADIFRAFGAKVSPKFLREYEENRRRKEAALREWISACEQVSRAVEDTAVLLTFLSEPLDVEPGKKVLAWKES